jgi:Ca2+-binding EF-hand superfamily protein
MEIFQIVDTHQDGNITVEELREEIALYWDRKIYRGTKPYLMERRDLATTAILEKDR